MATQHGIAQLLRKAWLPAASLGLIYYAGYHMVNGNLGLRSLVKIDSEIALKEAELEGLRSTRLQLERKVALLHPEHLDPDMLDERARQVLGLARSDELVVFMEN